MDTTDAVGLAYPGDELDELDIQVDWHVVLGDDALLTSRKQQLKNEPNTAILARRVCVWGGEGGWRGERGLR